jgi:two-component sensor histidine kinase
MRYAAWLLLFVLSSGLSAQPQVGVIDLRDAGTFEHHNLHGEWIFYPKWLPSETKKPTQSRPITVPERWKDAGIDALGYGTYQLTLKLPEPALYTLKIDNIQTAYRLLIDGKEVGRAGQVATGKATAHPSYARQSFTFRSSGTSEILIAVSNYHHRSGGIGDAIHIGPVDSMLSREKLLIARDLFLIGALLMMALYHFGLFLLRPRDRVALIFAGFALAFVVRQLTTGERFILTLWPEIPWDWLVRAEYASGYVALPLFVTFIARLYPTQSHTPIVRIFQIVSSLLVALTLFSPPLLFTQSREYFELLVIGFILYTLALLVRSAFARQEGAGIALGGFVVLAITIVHDILYMRSQIFFFGDLIPAGFFVFVLAWSFLLAQQYTRAFETIDHQRHTLKRYQEELEMRVDERTHALARSLSDKEMLLKEIYHRVKNNLQLVVSLIGLKMRRLHHPQAREALFEIESRIKAIALVHERLYRESGSGVLSLDEYIRAIAAQLTALHADRIVCFEVGGEQVELGLDQAVPLGLIVNELITNSLKYAFTGGESGTIRILLSKKERSFMLHYEDDGIGFDPEDSTNSQALGMRMIPSLCRQIEGRSRWLKPEQGMAFEVEAPLLGEQHG